MKRLLLTVLTIIPALLYAVQPSRVNRAGDAPTTVDSWIVEVRSMDPKLTARITETMAKLNDSTENRNLLLNLTSSIGGALVSGLVDAIVTETYNLVEYRKKQKKEWQEMIEKENVFVDSITYVKGLTDFYESNSAYGALDPSGMRFDGISIRGQMNGNDVIYMSCSIDRDKLDHLFKHSKFNIVLDTLVFYPLQCHLPNMMANGIYSTKEKPKKGKKIGSEGEIKRPGGNGYNFDDRENLRVGIEFSLFSSWINEAVQVHKDVELGKFRFNIKIPENDTVYRYYREDVLARADSIVDDEKKENFLAENLISVEGDSFIVPRSFMPLGGGKRLWGTGEYNMKVLISETCNFNHESEKGRNWREDYKKMRKMQNIKGEVQEYLETLWQQYGDKMVKTSYKTLLNTVADEIPLGNKK